MSRVYYDVVVQRSGQTWFTLWFSDDVDGVVTSGQRVLGFVSLQTAHAYAERFNWPMKNEPPTLIDLDRIAAWVFDPKQSIYPKRWLDAWNWLIDLARSIGATRSRVVISYEHASENDAYDKLFFGNNLPSIKHDPYVRKWSDAEITELRAIFQDGLNLFDQAIQSAPD